MSLDVGVLSFKKERKIREFGVHNDRIGDGVIAGKGGEYQAFPVCVLSYDRASKRG